MNKKNIWVIIPAYNESKRISAVLSQLKKYNVVVVDDGSKDDTYKIAKKYTSNVLNHIVNLGKGAAVKTGCDYAISRGATHLILMDSDGQHEPSEIPNFISAIENKGIVFGSRKFDKNMPVVLRFGNWFISKTVHIFLNVKISDSQSGYRAITKDTYQKIRWKSNDYGMESEMIAKVAKHKIKYSEIFIKTIYLDRHKGTTPLDGFKIVFNIIKWRLFA